MCVCVRKREKRRRENTKVLNLCFMEMSETFLQRKNPTLMNEARERMTIDCVCACECVCVCV